MLLPNNGDKIMSYRHRWEDVSYRGSPTWVCDLCGISRYDHDKNPKDCPKADQKEEEEKIAKLN